MSLGVLGATGNVGSELVAHLLEAGARVRIFARDEGKTKQWGSRVERVVGNLADASTRERFFDGLERVFTLSFIEEPPDLDRAVIASAGKAGVRQLVKLSTIGASLNIGIGREHREREQWIEASGIAWTFLRPGFFTSNVKRWVPMIRQGAVSIASADGPTCPISPRDIAEVAKLALLQSGHEGKSYELTGEEPISARQQIEIISGILGRPIGCVEIPIESLIGNMRKAGQPEWLLESLTKLWTDIRAGRGAFRNENFRQLSGHAPETFETWCRAHRAELE